MPYRLLPDLAWADVAFEVEEPDLEKLFETAADAVTDAMIRNRAAIRLTTKRGISLEAGDPEVLLHRFLEELVYLKDAERLVFGRFSARIQERGKIWRLDCSAAGEELDAERHEFAVDVKAVTWHEFELAPSDGGFRAVVVLDV